MSDVQRIGIYAGTFDPVHTGHVSFALCAMERARLDAVYYLPERQPRHKQAVTHMAHRMHMLQQALRPYPRLGCIELPDKHFSVIRVLPQLTARFGTARLVFLWGSDSIVHMTQWEHGAVLAQCGEHVVAMRGADRVETITAFAHTLGIAPSALHLLPSAYPAVASRDIRTALAAHKPAPGLLDSTRRYIAQQGLYQQR